MAKIFSFIALSALVTTAAFASEDPLVTFVPPAPTTLDSLQARVLVPSRIFAFLDSQEVEGRTIRLRFSENCVITCPPVVALEQFVPLGRLAAGTWRLEGFVNGAWFETVDLEVTASKDRASLALDPAAPGPADLVSLQVVHQTQPCQGEPVLAPVERTGNVFKVGLVVGEIEPGCSGDASSAPASLFADLGPLAPGAYRVDLWSLPADARPPELLDRLDFAVAAGGTPALLGRFRPSLSWRTPDGQSGPATMVPGSSEESALFTFFSAENWEVMVKVLDGCAINGHYWVFLAAATGVEFTLSVDDAQGLHPPYVYRNPPGLFSLPLGDTSAFPCTL